ncbi:MAG: L-rhamnose isomerase, partial [Enterococcus hulanensis]
LEPIEDLKEMELELDYTKRMALTEELKDFPYADVWNYFCEQNDAPVGMEWYEEVMNYERDILATREKELITAQA